MGCQPVRIRLGPGSDALDILRQKRRSSCAKGAGRLQGWEWRSRVRVFYFCPDVAIPSGGIRVLYRHVEILNRHGFAAFILHTASGFKLDWFAHKAPVKYADKGLPLMPDDVLVLPEGFPNLMERTQDSRFERAVFAQNWAYIFSALPPGKDWRHFGIRQVISNSQYVRMFIRSSMGLDSTIVPPSIDLGLFRPAARKTMQIACMPRKNSSDLHQIECIFRAAWPQHGNVGFVPIDNLPYPEVAKILSESAIYLSTGYPEGCPFPPLEAMACGCLVVGFSGYGGLEYMRHEENCFLTNDGNVLAAAGHLDTAVRLFAAGKARAMQAAARRASLRFSAPREERAVVSYWRRFALSQDRARRRRRGGSSRRSAVSGT